MENVSDNNWLYVELCVPGRDSQNITESHLKSKDESHKKAKPHRIVENSFPISSTLTI